MIITNLGNESFRVQFGETTLTFSTELKVKNGSNTPFIVTGPGEYEVGGVFIKGLLSEGADSKVNTIYTVSLENMNVCFLGALTNPELNAETVEELDEIDVLFVPVNTLSPSKAYKLAVSLEPKIVIPTMYDDASLRTFAKEAGSTVSPEQKLTLKKKDLEGKKVALTVLESTKE